MSKAKQNKTKKPGIFFKKQKNKKPAYCLGELAQIFSAERMHSLLLCIADELPSQEGLRELRGTFNICFPAAQRVTQCSLVQGDCWLGCLGIRSGDSDSLDNPEMHRES